MQHGSSSQTPPAPGSSEAHGRKCIEYARETVMGPDMDRHTWRLIMAN